MSQCAAALKYSQRGDSDTGMVIIAMLLSAFLFQGDPDVWDKLHAYVMHHLEINK
jgi:hypothetical protein